MLLVNEDLDTPAVEQNGRWAVAAAPCPPEIDELLQRVPFLFRNSLQPYLCWQIHSMGFLNETGVGETADTGSPLSSSKDISKA